MRVLLAGYNVDSAVLDELRRNSPPRDDVTPETLAASYARISRDARPADELRAAARAEVERARRSNQTIIFKMGHHSVAEHAVFNFDIIGASRLAIEEIERFRLCSFTEKSQRYITLGEDFVVPAEIRRAGGEDLFVSTVRAQNALYHTFYERLRPHVFDKHREEAENPRNHAVLDGWAKEDARYIVSLATEGQLGLTINGRNLELLIRRFAALESEEIRELNARLSALAKEVAPSIILFTEASEFDARTRADLERAAAALPEARRAGRGRGGRAGVALAGFTPDGDDRVLAALLHSASGSSYAACLERVKAAGPARRKEFVRAAFRRMEFYDFPLREFEHADLAFDLVVSASCFAQLKRHRMATLTRQPYDPALGVTVPPSIREIGAERGVPGDDRADGRSPCRPAEDGRPGRGLRPDQRPPPPGPDQAERPGALPRLAAARGRLGPVGDPRGRGGDVAPGPPADAARVPSPRRQGRLPGALRSRLRRAAPRRAAEGPRVRAIF